MTPLTNDWVRWLEVAGIVWIAALAVFVVWLSAPKRTEKADAELVRCHCRLVSAPHDWQLHDDWITP